MAASQPVTKDEINTMKTYIMNIGMDEECFKRQQEGALQLKHALVNLQSKSSWYIYEHKNLVLDELKLILTFTSGIINKYYIAWYVG